MDIRIKNVSGWYIFTDLLQWIDKAVDKGYLKDFKYIDIWFTGVDYQHIHIKFIDANDEEYTLWSYRRRVKDDDDVSDTILCKVADTEYADCFWGDIWEIDIEEAFNNAVETYYKYRDFYKKLNEDSCGGYYTFADTLRIIQKAEKLRMQ